MKIFKILFFLLFIPLTHLYSQNWTFKAVTTADEWTALRGEIDFLGPFVMYLKPYKGFCGVETFGWRRQHKIFSGYYIYVHHGDRIPLLGAIGYGDNNERVILYVPENFNDTIKNSDCHITNFKEMFFVHGQNDLAKLKWVQNGSKDTLDAKLEYAYDATMRSNASIILEVNEVELNKFDISQLSGLKYIDSINNLDAKLINNEYFLTFQFGQRSIPGGNGEGDCGAGYEEYLGFIHIDKKLEPVVFEKRLIGSCLNYDLIEKY